MSAAEEVAGVQEAIWANKIAQGFNTTDVPLEFCLLLEEVTEAFGAWKSQEGDLGEELADVAIFLYGLAHMVGVDLEERVRGKVSANAERAYVRKGHGWSKSTSSGVSS